MNKRKIIYFILFLIMAGIIFLFSSQNADNSNMISHRITIKIYNIITNKHIDNVDKYLIKDKTLN